MHTLQLNVIPCAVMYAPISDEDPDTPLVFAYFIISKICDREVQELLLLVYCFRSLFTSPHRPCTMCGKLCVVESKPGVKRLREASLHVIEGIRGAQQLR